MPSTSQSLLNYLRMVAAVWRDDPRDDAALLAQFAESGDEAAFRALVCRHGPLVWQTCRRILGDTPDAEDAFQAAFLALIRKAGRLRREPLAGWLHRVARQAALNADAGLRRRQSLQHHLQAVKQSTVEGEVDRAELYAALDEELMGLPERLRIPLVLRYLGGKTLEDVAHIVGCCRRVLGKRLARGEAMLRTRLEQRGLAVGVGSVSALLASTSGTHGAPTMPTVLIGSTVRAALRSLSFPLPSELSQATGLAGRVMKALLVTKMKMGAVLLGTMLCLTGGGLLAYQTLAANAAKVPQPADEPKGEAEPSGQTRIETRVDCYGDPLPEGALARLGTVRLRHPGVICSVAFSPDGKTVASGGKNGTVCLWDASTGREIRNLKIQPGQPLAMAFSPDKTMVLGGSDDGPVCLWNATSGKEIRTLKTDKEQVLAVAFSPDNKIVASAESNGVVRLWETATGKEIHTLRGHLNYVFSVAFSSDGKTVASGGADGTVRLWEVASGKEIRSLKGHKLFENIFAVAFSPDGRTLASGKEDGTVHLWEVASSKEIRTLKGHQGRVCSVAFSPSGQVVVSGGWDGTVRLWEAVTGKEIRTLKVAKGYDWSVAFSPDGKVVAVGGWNGMVYLWKMATGKPIRTSEGHEGCIQSVAFSLGGRIVASAGADGTVRLWEAANGKPIRTLEGHGGPVYSVAFSRDGKIVASAERDGTEQNGTVHQWEMDGTVHLWEMATGKEIRTLKGHKKNVWSVVFSPDGQTVASAGADGTVRLCEVSSGKELRILKGYVEGVVGNVQEVLSVAFSPDGKMVASGGRDDMVRLWDAASGKELRTLKGHRGAVCSVIFSPDGQTVASGGYDRTVRLWETAIGKEVRTLQVHRDTQYWITMVAFSHDGGTLAVTSRDCVQLWDLLSGAALPSLTGHRTWVQGVAFSPDSRVLVSVSGDATGLVWNPNYSPTRLTAKLDPNALEVLWADLASMDAMRARRAVWTLAAIPSQSVPLLCDRLRPVDAEMGKRLARLVSDLDADDFRVREKTQRELAEYGADVKPALRKVLEERPSTEMRRRLEHLLEMPATYSEGVLRSLRAVAVLEQVGTPEARQVLKRLVAGVPGFRLTQDAQAALSRLDGMRQP